MSGRLWFGPPENVSSADWASPAPTLVSKKKKKSENVNEYLRLFQVPRYITEQWDLIFLRLPFIVEQWNSVVVIHVPC